MDTAKLVLQFVQAFLAWPVAAVVIAAIILTHFKADIKILMARIATIRLPGGSEVLTSQVERSAEESTKDQKPQVPQSEASQPLPLPPGINLNAQQLDAVRQLYLAERANAYLWEYRYLNYFLAYRTQQVLDWFATLTTPTSRSFFDNLWSPGLPQVDERNAILTALQMHYLIYIDGELMSISPKGREYKDWRGPLPQPPTQ